MIRLLRGTILHREKDGIVLDVHGVGHYLRTLPSHQPEFGVETTFHTHLAVRENALDLYGFLDPRELELFELLLTIPRVGPKSALDFLGKAQPAIIKKAIADEDHVYLATVSDLSKKNAEKIVTALKGKIDPDEVFLDDAPEADDTLTDVVETLIALGYTPKAARDASREIPQDITDTQARIKVALSILSR